MPIMPFGDKVLIANKYRDVSRGPDAMLLGEMSIELAIYLEAKLNEQKARELYDQIVTDESVRAMQFFDQPELKDTVGRCYNAGNRGYSPRLIDTRNNLTEEGIEKANQAIPVIAELNEISGGIAYKPNEWRNAEDFFIIATIPVRSLRMLQVIYRAITRAEQKDANEALGTNFPLPFPTDDDLPEQTDKSNGKNKTDEGMLEALMNVQDNVDMPQTKFTPQLYQSGANREAYVPTATFNQKAKTDIKYLIKFGLVELKAYVGGHRGRPKHVVRHSRAGSILLVNLEEKKII